MLIKQQKEHTVFISFLKMKSPTNNILLWKQKWLDDKSGYWYEAKVPILKWEYIIEEPYTHKNTSNAPKKCNFEAKVFYSKFDDDASRLTKQTYTSIASAKNACEKHLINTSKNLNKWLNKNYDNKQSNNKRSTRRNIGDRKR